MNSWHSYPSIYAMGHRYISDLLNYPVLVEEKVDGSQFSFGVEDGIIRVRSKGCEMIVDAPEKMFTKAVETVKNLAPILNPGWTYRAEYLAKPKHSSLIYSRTPKDYLIIFDINRGHEDYLTHEEKRTEAERIGLECVPKIYEGKIGTIDEFRAFLETESVLGGQKIEGVVVKPVGYGVFGKDKKCLMGKFVSEAFKETHAREWKESNPSNGDVLMKLGDEYTTQARWMKAIQHLNESGKLEGSPKDIGTIMKEIPEDILKDSEQEIKQKLFDWAWPSIRRMTTRGLPEWYKEELLKKQFEGVQP